MKRRTYIRSGVVEELDQRQERLMQTVLEAVRTYYRELYRTKPKYDHPLSLSILMQLTNRSGSSVMNAVRILANSVVPGEDLPPLIYDRTQTRKGVQRPYRIFLRSQ